MSLKSRLAKLDKLVKLLPMTIEVASLASSGGATVLIMPAEACCAPHGRRLDKRFF